MHEHPELQPNPFEAWHAVERIYVGRIVADTKEELLEFIEEPLRPAIGTFYDKHIVTLLSSCNANDFYQGQAWISVDWGSLSEENRKIIEAYPHHERAVVEGTDIEIVGLFFPIAPQDTPEDVSKRALAMAETFHSQGDEYGS